MAGFTYTYDISFLKEELRIPDSYFGIILKPTDIGAIEEAEKARIRNIQAIYVADAQTPLSIEVNDSGELEVTEKMINALKKAIDNNQLPIIRKIFQQISKKDISYEDMARITELTIQNELAPEFLDNIFANKNADIDGILPNTFTALEFAIQKRSSSIVYYLLQKGARVDTKNPYDTFKQWTPLVFAIVYFPSAVPLLLAKGANPNNDIFVLYKGKFVKVHFLGQNIQRLLDKNDLTTLKLLLDAGADPNARDVQGVTMLMRSAQNENYDFVKTLLDHKADKNLQLPPIYKNKYTAYDFFVHANPGDRDLRIEALLL